jgi:magnesium chelatase family protein
MDIFAYEPLGLEGSLIKIEVDIRRGIPAVDIVGLAAPSVRESRERVRVAIRNSNFDFPQDRVLINLSPADLPKQGSQYDLPIAIKILIACKSLPDCGVPALVMGELTLDGYINSVRGTLPAFISAYNLGIDTFILPKGNQNEFRNIHEGKVYCLEHIAELSDVLISIRAGLPYPLENHSDSEIDNRKKYPMRLDNAIDHSSNTRNAAGIGARDDQGLDFSDYLGNEKVVRALAIAAAGKHNVLLFGPPGSGKTMAALRFTSLLPGLREREVREIAAIWSLKGKAFLGNEGIDAPDKPPMRSPHHSASLEGIIGGGYPPLPGEISMAHKGVLFLDETPEFRRDVLQALREPLERGYVSVVRAGRVLRYPADFQLLLAANPCPCGNLGSPNKTCLCSPSEIQRYWKKLGGPLMDRVDMRIPVAVPEIRTMMRQSNFDLHAMVASIQAAVSCQMDRTNDEGGIFNGRLQPGDIKKHCALGREYENFFLEKVDGLGLSARACHSILKIARTIADLDCASAISREALEEAVGYRVYGEGEIYWPF